jgi:uncharacterized protein YukE
MSTKVDPDVVEAQASSYETTRDNLSQQLENSRTQAKNLVDSSSSEATKALLDIIDTWVNNTKKTMLEHMTTMAKDIRHAKDDQLEVDSQGAKAILNIPPATSTFLGG